MTNIICLVRDRYRLTEQTLDSLYAHTLQSQFNLTVVDDGSTDFRVRRLLERVCGRANATLIRIENGRHILSAAKKIGVRWSELNFGRGEWLCLCDNDVFFLKGWLDSMIGSSETGFEAGFRLWGGQQHPYHLPITDSEYREYAALPGTHWFMPWFVWDDNQQKLISNAEGVCQGEDVNFGNSVREYGRRIGVVDPHVVIDCGWTNSDGKPAPGIELRQAVRGVYHE